ncbi:hypothetical protein DRO54_05570 [Candidatus Bathyarchaeota archaeon]|nr:MAG: hypothetical protein DRO54_05570 [Candidatus Bathyarchaeota archaeon]
MKPLFVIEHLELEIGKWLYIEYMHASEIVGKGRLVFTNVKNPRDARLLSKLGKIKHESFAEIFSSEEIIILDPKAPNELTPEDFTGKEAVIIGGILGDYPPRGRTAKLVTAKLPTATVRNIGEEQFSIDGAVYIAKLVSEGKRLEEIPVIKGLTIKLSENAEIFLPYAYPLKSNLPVIHKDLIEYLRSEEIVRDEERLLKTYFQIETE